MLRRTTIPSHADCHSEAFESVMVSNLSWNPSRHVAGVEAVGKSGRIYIVMAMPDASATAEVHVASARVNWDQEPHYLGPFGSYRGGGLEAAQRVCQAYENSIESMQDVMVRQSPCEAIDRARDETMRPRGGNGGDSGARPEIPHFNCYLVTSLIVAMLVLMAYVLPLLFV